MADMALTTPLNLPIRSKRSSRWPSHNDRTRKSKPKPRTSQVANIQSGRNKHSRQAQQNMRLNRTSTAASVARKLEKLNLTAEEVVTQSAEQINEGIQKAWNLMEQSGMPAGPGKAPTLVGYIGPHKVQDPGNRDGDINYTISETRYGTVSEISSVIYITIRFRERAARGFVPDIAPPLLLESTSIPDLPKFWLYVETNYQHPFEHTAAAGKKPSKMELKLDDFPTGYSGVKFYKSMSATIGAAKPNYSNFLEACEHYRGELLRVETAKWERACRRKKAYFKGRAINDRGEELTEADLFVPRPSADVSATITLSYDPKTR